MKKLFVCFLLGLSLLSATKLMAQGTNSAPAEPKDAAHLRMLNERAAKIVAQLGITDSAKSNRVHWLIVLQYDLLAKIHDERDAQIKKAEEQANKDNDKKAAEQAIAYARAKAQAYLDYLHAAFLKTLCADLSSEQVDAVKDGMTYGVLMVTYNAYSKSFPELTEEQKAQIKAWLIEAREIAMDGGTAEEKHAVFGKYKGRINNYLVKAGYDLKQGEQNLRKAGSKSSDSQPK